MVWGMRELSEGESLEWYFDYLKGKR